MNIDITLIESVETCTNSGPTCFSCPAYDSCPSHDDYIDDLADL